MGIYRDDLESAQLRIETLEAKLAASNAEAAANEAEANELRRKVERLERQLGELQTDVPTLITRRPASRKYAALTAVLVTSCALGFAAAYLSHNVSEQVALHASHPPSVAVVPVTPQRSSPPPYLPVREPHPGRVMFAPSRRPEPGAFDRDVARRALAKASGEAARCPSTVTGRGKIVATFAPNGGVTSATVGPPFESSPAAPCIVAAFRSIQVPAFEGGAVTVSKSFFIR